MQQAALLYARSSPYGGGDGELILFGRCTDLDNWLVYVQKPCTVLTPQKLLLADAARFDSAGCAIPHRAGADAARFFMRVAARSSTVPFHTPLLLSGQMLPLLFAASCAILYCATPLHFT